LFSFKAWRNGYAEIDVGSMMALTGRSVSIVDQRGVEERTQALDFGGIVADIRVQHLGEEPQQHLVVAA